MLGKLYPLSNSHSLSSTQVLMYVGVFYVMYVCFMLCV